MSNHRRREAAVQTQVLSTMRSYMKLVVLLAFVVPAKAELNAVEAIEPVEKKESLDPVAEESLDGEKDDERETLFVPTCVLQAKNSKKYLMETI